MFSAVITAGVSVVALASSVAAADPTYSLVFNHQGANFFNNWNFYNGIDTNNTGNVLYQTKQQATDLGLIGLNSAGNTIIKVDNKTSGVGDPTFGRPSVMMTSNYQLSSGNLLLFDAVHLPFGCSVWPAFWSQGQVWPDDGEIDILEGVNLQKNNRFSLHTLNGCKHPDASSALSSLETGSLVSTDCFNQTNFNQGCIVEVPTTASYGADFASAGGGVYAMLWNDTGISLWFFQRSNIPSDLPTDNPNPSAWPLPTAWYPTSSCDWQTFIKPQTLILDITICGNFALNVFNQTCSGNCLDLVQTPSNYDTAYFEISYIKVFQQTNGSTPSVSPEGTASPTGTQSGSSASGTSSSGGGSGSSTGAASPLMSVSTLASVFSLFLAVVFLRA
ncbi:hypothetical protein SCHPADRAFT_845310 [Schizopora paradoxa]|uniref:GH16 domain-containing protein n=1 Tax=Schizopora paradoxa TaxID=27342 RepID=A0A0H2S2K0_9AGAM|nr:hypothetical protein SCHPADRAFT_845310 [Schizopora paradoxa]